MHLNLFQRKSYFYNLLYCQGCPPAGNEVYQQADAWWYVIIAVSSIFCKYNDSIILKEGKIIPPDSQLVSCSAATACIWWGLLVGCCCLQEYRCWCCRYQVLWKRCCCQPWICSSGELCSVSLWISTKELFLVSRPLCIAEGKSQHSLPENSSNNTWCLGKKSEW